MVIPAGFGQLTFLFGGMCLPNGAAATLGFTNSLNQSPTEVADDLFDQFQLIAQGTLSADTILQSVLVKLGPDATGPFIERTVGQVGAQGATSMTAQVAYNIRKTSALGGKKNRGRMFWPGVPEAAYDDAGLIEAAFVAQLDGAFEDLVDRMLTVFLEPVILHTDPGDTPTPITSMTVGSRSITQRRRNR